MKNRPENRREDKTPVSRSIRIPEQVVRTQTEASREQWENQDRAGKLDLFGSL